MGVASLLRRHLDTAPARFCTQYGTALLRQSLTTRG
jgi:hypothetical protein